MTKKILAIHSNNLFFGKNTPSFYQFLADTRGVGDEMRSLLARYETNKEDSPLLLQKVYGLTMDGLTKSELKEYVKKFFINTQNVAISFAKTMTSINSVEKRGYKVIVFTSYPMEIFLYPINFHQEAIGPIANYKNNKISGLKPLNIRYEQKVREWMNLTSNLYQRFTTSPSRFGLTTKLVDMLITYDKQTPQKNLVVLGSSTSAKPMHEIGGISVEKLEELL